MVLFESMSTVTNYPLVIDPQSKLYIASSSPLPRVIENRSSVGSSLLHRSLDTNATFITQEQAEAIPQSLLFSFIKDSKFLHRLMLQSSSLIDFAPLRKVIHTQDHSNNGVLRKEDGNKFLKVQIPEELIPKDGSSNLASFVEDLFNGNFPFDIAFKPDSRAGAGGLIRIQGCGDSFHLKMLNYVNIGFLEGNDLRSTREVLYYCNEHNIQMNDLDEGAFTIVLKKDQKSKQHILNILAVSLLDFSPPGGREPEFISEHSALIEDWQDLVKIDNKVVEARYFLDPSQDQVGLMKATRVDGVPSKSFMKTGRTSFMVNYGHSGKQWPSMHSDLIKALSLECSESEFNQYMARLCSSIGRQYRKCFLIT